MELCFSRQLAESSPYFEVIRSQNKEVLFLYEPADEVFLSILSVPSQTKDHSLTKASVKGGLPRAESVPNEEFGWS